MTDDLIGRAEAQTAIQFAARRYMVAHEAHGEGQVVWSDNLINVTDAMNVLRDLPSVQPKQRWIPVTERLPEDNTRVQVTFANGEVGQSSWHKENEYNNGFDAVMHGVTDRHFVTFGVIAWMPLPKPYQEGR